MAVNLDGKTPLMLFKDWLGNLDLECFIGKSVNFTEKSVQKESEVFIHVWHLHNSVHADNRKRPILLSRNSSETIQSQKYLLYDVYA